jgi:HlyD family secretion protein
VAQLADAKAVEPAERIAAKADMDIAQATVEMALAAIERREIDVRLAQQALGHCTMHSPVDGIIITRNVSQSSRATSAHAPLFLIADSTKKMQVWASVSEADIGKIAKGQPVRFTVDALPGKSFTGHVSQIRLNAQMLKDAVQYTVVTDIDDDAGLLPYLTANIRIETSPAK